jgi:hypothetical protein
MDLAAAPTHPAIALESGENLLELEHYCSMLLLVVKVAGEVTLGSSSGTVKAQHHTPRVVRTCQQ